MSIVILKENARNKFLVEVLFYKAYHMSVYFTLPYWDPITDILKGFV